AFLKDCGRADYLGITDEEALAAFHLLARTEGILPALESSHAVAQALKLARDLPAAGIVLCNLSGRGDKDVHTVAARGTIPPFHPNEASQRPTKTRPGARPPSRGRASRSRPSRGRRNSIRHSSPASTNTWS